MSVTNHSTGHTHKRHTQKAVTSKLPRNSNAHITSKALHMTSISLLLRASTKPIPCDTRELARCCGDEVMNLGGKYEEMKNEYVYSAGIHGKK